MADTKQSKGLAILTGSSRGLGHELAAMLAKAGWQVYGFSRSASDIVSENYYHVPMDLADLTEVENYFEGEFLRILESKSFLQLVLINNAARVSPVMPVCQIRMSDLADAFQLNTIVPIWLMGYCQRYWGNLPLTIVNISSGAATKAYPSWAVYCSTKAALRMAGMVISVEKSKSPIRVLAYAPGVLDTRMQEELRSLDPELFPDLPRFQKLFEDGELVDPTHPSREIADILGQGFSESQFLEIRYGEHR